jgi:hypothetical protein
MPSFLNEYDIKKIALFAVFVLAVIGIIYLLATQQFQLPALPSLPSASWTLPSSLSGCADANSEKQDSCIRQKSITLTDYSLCNYVKAQGLKDICFSTAAVTVKDFTICNNIQDANLHDSCLTNFNDLNNAEFCDNYIDKDSCLLSIALNKGTPDLCDQIINPQVKDRCYSIAPREITGEECLKITDSLLKDQCYFNLSYKTQNPMTCESIVDENLHDSCFLGLSLTASEGKYSSEFCEDLKALNNKNLCFSQLAIQEKNQATCESIKGDDTLKNTCINVIEALQ